MSHVHVHLPSHCPMFPPFIVNTCFCAMCIRVQESMLNVVFHWWYNTTDRCPYFIVLSLPQKGKLSCTHRAKTFEMVVHLPTVCSKLSLGPVRIRIEWNGTKDEKAKIIIKKENNKHAHAIHSLEYPASRTPTYVTAWLFALILLLLLSVFLSLSCGTFFAASYSRLYIHNTTQSSERVCVLSGQPCSRGHLNAKWKW